MSSSEWKMTKLGELLNFRRGHDLPKTKMNNGIFPVVGSNGVIGFHNEFTTKAPCLTIGRSGNIGNPCYINLDCWAHNTTLYVDDYKDNCPKYLYYLLKTLDLGHYGGGSAVPTLNRNHIHPIEIIATFNRNEQKAIASILSCLDDKIEINKKINDNLAQQANAIFKSWFVDFDPYSDGEFQKTELGRIPTEWRIGTFQELVEKTLAGDWGKEFLTGNNTEEVYCIRGADIPEVKIGNKGKMPVRFILPKNYRTKRLEPNDIVVEISGGSPTQSTGRVAAITRALLNRYDKGMICTNFCKAIKPTQSHSMFVYFYWQHLYDKNVMYSYENGTTGIKNFNINGFLECERIVLPPVKEIQHFNTVIEPLFTILFANGLESEKLAEIRDALIPKLMSGELSAADL